MLEVMELGEESSVVGAPPGGGVALSVRGVSKVFPGTRALDGVDLDVRHGEIHGLVGGNGSGKSTLIKILCGVYQGDSGVVRIGGQELEASHMRPKMAHELGVRVVHQDFAVFPDLSLAENMMLGADYPTAVGRVRWRELRRRARVQIERFDIAAEPDTLLRDLPVAARSQVAIARALGDVGSGEGVLILDEPTVALPAHEVGLLLSAVRALAAAGHAVVFVSHRLDEVLSLTDRVTVLRDGRVAAEHRTEKLTEAELIEAILGRRTEEVGAGASAGVIAGEPVLKVSELYAGPLRGVDVEVMPGEVVGVAGLLGSGRSELLRAVYGDLPASSGQIAIRGKRATFSRIDQAIASDVVMIPEDRVSGAAFADLTVDENLDVGVLRRYWKGWFSKARLRADAAKLRQRFRVRAASGSVAMKSLSGGNQQKAILARWLRRDPTLLLLDEPTQGVDVGARADIHAAVREITNAGGGALLVLSDLEELAQVADRAVVLRSGVISARVPREELNAHHLNELMYMDSQRINGSEATSG
jgi:ribose transport system ATP-binding protein